MLDDGVATDHPEFAGKLVAERDFMSGATGPGSGKPTSPGDNHGTACAGVAVAAGIRSHGSAPDSGLIAAVTPMWLGTDDETEMFRWCVDTAGAHVISCSWGPAQPYALPDITEAVLRYCANEARGGKGVPILFAAGNESEDMTTDGYAASDHVIAVAASTDADTAAWYSDFGPKIDVCAPSNGGSKAIFTTDRPGSSGYNAGSAAQGDASGDYTNDFGGTSSATPLVAGVAALVLAANPSLTASEVRNVLRSAADRIGEPSAYVDGHHPRFGAGRINAERAVTEAASMLSGGGQNAKSLPTISTPSSHVRGSGPPTFSVDAGGWNYFTVEVTTDPSLFNAAQASSRRSEDTFYSSFDDLGGLTESPFTLPAEAWRRLRHAASLAYRVLASDSLSGSSSLAYSMTDADAMRAPTITLLDGSPTGGSTTSGAVGFPSGVMLDRVVDPVDGEDYRDDVANGIIALIDTEGRLEDWLSANFTLREFAARSGRYRYARIAPELVEGLQRMRDAAGAAVTIRSAYRPPALNHAVGGARRSQHLTGRAADLLISGRSPLQAAELAFEHLGPDIGIGLGASTIHVDLRGSLTT